VNPYRVVRFKNTTPFVLEPGPISIYSGGSFVGEGVSEIVGAGTSATIPFAVEPGIIVEQKAKDSGQEMRFIRMVRGILTVETFSRKTTTWTAKAQTKKDGYTVLIRHPKSGWNYKLKERPNGTEDLPDGYLIPLTVVAGKLSGSIKVVEQTPSRMEMSIWHDKAIGVLQKLLIATNLGAAERAKLEPIVKLRQQIGRINTKIDGLQKQENQLNSRAYQLRENLRALKKDRSPQAAQLRRKIEKRLEEFTSKGDEIGRQIVTLRNQKMEKRIQLDDLLENLELRAPKPSK